MKPSEEHLWLFRWLIWQHVIRATSWLPSVFHFQWLQNLISAFQIEFPDIFDWSFAQTGFFRSVWNGDAIKDCCQVLILNGDKCVGHIFCCSCCIYKTIFCPFLVCLQRRWRQRLPQRTEDPPLDRSSLWNQFYLMWSCCNGDGNVMLCEINRLNGQARADVCINLYIVQKSCVALHSCASILSFPCAVLWPSRYCFFCRL